MKVEKKAKISLEQWIVATGYKNIAKMLDIHESSISHWRRGWILPRAEQMLKIEKHSKGRLTIRDMVEAHFSAANEKNRWANQPRNTKKKKKKAAARK